MLTLDLVFIFVRWITRRLSCVPVEMYEIDAHKEYESIIGGILSADSSTHFAVNVQFVGSWIGGLHECSAFRTIQGIKQYTRTRRLKRLENDSRRVEVNWHGALDSPRTFVFSRCQNSACLDSSHVNSAKRNLNMCTVQWERDIFISILSIHSDSAQVIFHPIENGKHLKVCWWHSSTFRLVRFHIFCKQQQQQQCAFCHLQTLKTLKCWAAFSVFWYCFTPWHKPNRFCTSKSKFRKFGTHSTQSHQQRHRIIIRMVYAILPFVCFNIVIYVEYAMRSHAVRSMRFAIFDKLPRLIFSIHLTVNGAP